MVRAQKKLIDFLGIEKLFSIVGGSMGGMQVLQWANDYPDKMLSAIPIATTMRHTPQQIAFNEVGRQSVMADIAWNGGHYYSTGNPERGLSVARMLGHITYMSDISMKEKFPIEKDKERKAKFNFNADFEVEEYLRHRGSTFVKRFDANSYLYISKAMDHFDVNNDDFLKDKNINIKFLVLSFKSDWLYPAEQSEDIVKSLKLRGQKVTYCNIDSTYGHDAFLLEKEDEGKIITSFLNNLEGGVISGKK